MRIYLPSTLSALADFFTDGGLGSGPHDAFAVTPALREWYVEGDVEELEYVALSDAAEVSLRRLAAQPAAPRRRVVIAADVPDESVTPQSGQVRSRVVVACPVPLAAVAAVHLDEEAAIPTTAAAIEALAAADAGDEDARFTVDEAAGYSLLWYASQEIPDLLR